MTVTISPDDPRSVRALAVLATADGWVKGHTKDGPPFLVVPGSNGRVYWTNTRDCTCLDRRQRGETCKHIRAVRLWTIEHKAKAPAPKPAPARVAELPRYPVRPTDPFHYCACGILVERLARLCDACADRTLALRVELGMAEVA